jgi:type I restriction enzyme S subunit
MQQKKMPALRFAPFADAWEMKQLGKIGTFFSGGTPLTSKKTYFNGTIPFIRSGEIHATQTEQFLTEAGLLNSAAKKVEIGDLLYALYGATSGEVGISKINGAINQAVLCIRTHLDTPFLANYLSFKKENIVNTYLQGGQGNLSAEIIKSLEIPCPSLAEQQQITTFFAAIDTRIAQLKQQLILLDAYKKGVMQQIFSRKWRFKQNNGTDFPDWEEQKLGDIAKIYDGTHQTPVYVAQGIPFYSVEQITADDFQKTKFIAPEVFEKENLRVKIEKGDILMTRIGDIGTSKYIDWEVNASFYVSVALIKPSSKHNSKYVNQFISTAFFQTELWNRTIHVAFPKKINLGEIGNCLLQLPCREEQTLIADFLSAIDAKRSHVHTQIAQTEVWKKGLFQRMFV